MYIWESFSTCSHAQSLGGATCIGQNTGPASHVDADASVAVLQGRGVSQQNQTALLRRLLQDHVQESRHADEGQRLAAAGSQREVSLRHPSQRQPAAVGQNTGQRRRTHAPDRTGWLQLLSVSRLLRPTAARILKQLLEVRGRRNAHHRMQRRLAFAQQTQTHPHQTPPAFPPQLRSRHRGQR